MKILFWLIVACDTLALLFFFVLGLAAAGSTKDSPLSVAAYMLGIPGLILVAAIVVFTRSTTALGRSVALLLVALPILIIVVQKAITTVEIRQSLNEEGDLVYFREGPLREIAVAIANNDTVTVARLAPTVDVNKRGFANATLLGLALRKLEDAPTQLRNIEILLNAGADPNLKSDDLPLEIALQSARTAGVKPAVLLLNAGADPNALGQFGPPVWFGATGANMPPEVLSAMFEHGADLKQTDRDGLSVVFQAANSANWKAVLLLLEKGVDYKNGRTVNGETFTQMVDSYARTFGDTAGVKEVQEFLKGRSQ